MKKRKVKTYLDTLMADEEFRERFEVEHQDLMESCKRKAGPNK